MKLVKKKLIRQAARTTQATKFRILEFPTTMWAFIIREKLFIIFRKKIKISGCNQKENLTSKKNI